MDYSITDMFAEAERELLEERKPKSVREMFKLSEVTDCCITWVQEKKMSPHGAKILVEAIEAEEIKIENGHVVIPFTVFKKLFENNFQR